MKKKLQKIIKIISPAIFLLAMLSFIFIPTPASAWSIFGYELGFGIPFYDLPTAGEIGMDILLAVLGWLSNVMGLMLGLAISVLDLVTSPILFDEVFFSGPALAGLQAGWGLVRDFVNMFFILILVFLAIATILRINRYSDKKMLLYVVMAALLVNFSLPITMIVIDASNLAMSFFMSNLSPASGSFGNALLHNMGLEDALKATGSSDGQIAVALLVSIVFKFIMGFMLLCLSLTLIVRMIAFWVLIILSPLAFFAMALPGTMISKIKDGWVSKLLGWAFYGPIMLFFFWIALVMVTATTDAIVLADHPEKLQMKSAAGISGSEDSFFVGAFGIIIPFATAVYMLFYGYSLSRSFANSMGSSAAGLLDKGLNKIGTGAKVTAGMLTLGGSVWAANQYKAAKDAAAEQDLRLFGKIPLNKKARAEQAKERKDKYGKHMATFSEDPTAYQSAEVNDQLKSWDDKGVPETDKLKGMVNGSESASDAERRAAALRLAREGKLDAENYRNSMAAFEGNPKLAARFKDQAKKNNRSAMIEYDVEQEVKKRQSAGEVITDEQRKAIKQDEYTKHLNGMTITAIADQDKSFHESDEFKTFMRNKVASGDWSEEYLKKQNLSAEKQAIWRKENFFAGGSSNAGPSVSDADRADLDEEGNNIADFINRNNA